MLPEIDFVGEGRSDDAVARRLIERAGGVPGNSFANARKSGKDALDRRLCGLNAGARHGRVVLVLRDLDRDADCAGALARRLLPSPNPRLLLRVAVRSVDAWLMADRAGYARFCGVPVGDLSDDPERLRNPKTTCLELAGRRPASRLGSALRDGRVRRVPDWQVLGAWHAEFVRVAWSPDAAAARSPSLERCMARLAEVVRVA